MVGVAAASWCDWEHDRKLPRVDKAIDLERLTRGEVSVRDFGELAAGGAKKKPAPRSKRRRVVEAA